MESIGTIQRVPIKRCKPKVFWACDHLDTNFQGNYTRPGLTFYLEAQRDGQLRQDLWAGYTKYRRASPWMLGTPPSFWHRPDRWSRWHFNAFHASLNPTIINAKWVGIFRAIGNICAPWRTVYTFPWCQVVQGSIFLYMISPPLGFFRRFHQLPLKREFRDAFLQGLALPIGGVATGVSISPERGKQARGKLSGWALDFNESRGIQKTEHLSILQRCKLFPLERYPEEFQGSHASLFEGVQIGESLMVSATLSFLGGYLSSLALGQLLFLSLFIFFLCYVLGWVFPEFNRKKLVLFGIVFLLLLAALSRFARTPLEGLLGGRAGVWPGAPA